MGCLNFFVGSIWRFWRVFTQLLTTGNLEILDLLSLNTNANFADKFAQKMLLFVVFQFFACLCLRRPD